ncbi:NfeD family protein [Lentibacter sp.]|uniref:NfeD family protein n=1 Tax=Lentibacter sp. TaxID=2024994 RepID=UPI003F696DE3
MDLVTGDGIWSLWWVWLAAAVGLGILEILAPGFILLGFAIGAAVVGVLLAVGGPLGAMLGGSFALMLAVFAVFSLIGWIGLRRTMGVRKGQVKTWDTDINED